MQPGAIGYDYYGRSVIPTQDGGYLVVGDGSFWVDQEYFNVILKTDSLGNQEWFESICGYWLPYGCGLNSVVEIGVGDYIAAGSRSVNGDSTGSNVEVIRFSEYTGVPQVDTPQPQTFKLYPAYPNPFNSIAKISYELPVPGPVQIEIYNLLGQRVSTLQNKMVEAGRHEITWNAGDLPSGIYFIRMVANNFGKVMKVVLLK
jgi:hypothetical protein